MHDLQENIGTSLGPVNIGSTRLTRAFNDAMLLDDAALSRLREAVCEYVRIQQGVETPPESIIARVKTLVNQAGAADAPFEARQAIMRRVVDWCIKAYYGDEGSAQLVHRDVPQTSELPGGQAS